LVIAIDIYTTLSPTTTTLKRNMPQNCANAQSILKPEFLTREITMYHMLWWIAAQQGKKRFKNSD